MSESFSFGREAESRAAIYFKNNGYIIRERNYRYQKAEVDLIAENEEFLVAVEVKARSSTYFGTPESFVNSKKIKLLVMAMDAYARQHHLDLEVRFDIMSYTCQNGQWSYQHIENAFYSF